jgi:putative transcriptional regulator
MCRRVVYGPPTTASGKKCQAWTQQELAKAVGVSRQSINSIERNRYVPSLPLALKFAEVFDCPTDGIFTLEEK